MIFIGETVEISGARYSKAFNGLRCKVADTDAANGCVQLAPLTNRPDGAGLAAFWWPTERVKLVAEDQAQTDYQLAHDAVDHPAHYTSHPSGIEVIEITRHMGFCLGNVVKYALRADLKGNDIEDLRKAIKYLKFELETRERFANRPHEESNARPHA